MTDRATRVAFAANEWRYETAEKDQTFRDRYPNAREIVIEGQLDEASALAFATKYLAEVDTVAQAFEVQIEGVIHLEDLVGSPTRYVCSFPGYVTDGRAFRLTAVEVDYLANRSTLTVRG